jgi:hypothetical protein
MFTSYADAYNNYDEKRAEYFTARFDRYSLAKARARASGRYVASLQALKRAAIREGRPTDHIDDELKDALDYHREELHQLDLDNRRGQNGQKYSVVRELSTGMRMLMNSIKQKANATTSAEKAAANKEIEKSIERNLKNIVKAPIALTTKVLKQGVVATVLFAPVSLFMGILHVAWECMDSKKSPYEGKFAAKLSQGFADVMSKINTKVQKI